MRDEVEGQHIKTKKQFLAKEGQFLFSRIDARNGAFGLVNKDVHNAVVTNDFPVYDIDESKVNPRFFEITTGSKPFFELCHHLSSGTTGRQRVDEDSFLGIEIPLPPLAIQEKLVQDYEQKIQAAQEAETKANDLEKGIEDYLLDALGIEIEKPEEKKKDSQYKFLQFVELKGVSRWDVWNIDKSYQSTKYTNTTLENVVIGTPKYGANSKARKKVSEYRYIRITDINEDGSLNKDIVSAKDLESQYILKENDFLLARSGATVGKSFLYKKEFGKAIYAGYLIRFRLDESKILPEYLLYFTKSSIYKHWINSNQRISAQPNINSKEFLNSVLVLPPLAIQNEIVAHIQTQKSEIKRLRALAEELRTSAKADFEQEIFN